MHYKPLETAVNYFKDLYYGAKSLAEKVGCSLIPYSRLEKLAYAPIPTDNAPNNPIGYGAVTHYFAKKTSFDRGFNKNERLKQRRKESKQKKEEKKKKGR